MSKYFKHTPQQVGEANQVENLAREVDVAFTEVEDELFKDNKVNASIPSSIGSLDNKYIREYVPNKGIINNYVQSLYFPTNSKEASLDLIPNASGSQITNQQSPSTVYTYKSNGVLENPTDYCFVGKKVVLGKRPDNSTSLVITYKGYNSTTPDDTSSWPFELKFNVLQEKLSDNSWKRDFNYTRSGNVVTVTGANFRSKCSTFIQGVNSLDLEKYVAIYSSSGRRIDNVSKVNITNSSVSFTTTDSIETSTVRVYVANSSLGELLEGIYRLFYAHDHDTNGGNNVNHGSLLGLFENTYDSSGNPVIVYNTSSLRNYDHPQYLNREGFVNNPGIYNNAYLGDFLLASTSNDNRKNNISSNSVKLVFGEHASGSKIYYNSKDECLWLDSVSKHGFKLVTPLNKRALSINDHSLVDTTYTSPDTSKALKVTLRAEDNTKLGVLQLTRKLIDSNGVAVDDDKAKLLSYSSEFSFTFIKNSLVINNGAKLQFGNPPVFEISQKSDGIHFSPVEDGGVSTGASDVRFSGTTHVDTLKGKHIDAEAVHITQNQKLTFGSTSHSNSAEGLDYINYENNHLTYNSLKPFVYKQTGRRVGTSFGNGRQYIYSSIPSGATLPLADNTPTDLYIENSGKTYFIQSGYTFNPGITNLTTLPLSDTVAKSSTVNYLEINYQDNQLANFNGVRLNYETVKLFSQRDEQNVETMFLHSPYGISVVSSYTKTVGGTPLIKYGRVKAEDFRVIGDKNNPFAGFFGNVIVPSNSKLEVAEGATVTFNTPLTFTKDVNITGSLNTSRVNIPVIDTQTLNVSSKTTTKDLSVTGDMTVTGNSVLNRINQNSTNDINNFSGVSNFNNICNFSRPVNFNSTVSGGTGSFDSLTLNNLSVTGTSRYNQLEVDKMEVSTELRFSRIMQTNPAAESDFIGRVKFSNNVALASNSYFIVGNANIETTRATDGFLIKSDEVRGGTNSLVSAGKVIAGKGVPSGNGDRTGGFSFASSTGAADGDTGLFADKNVSSPSDSDLVFYIDGVEALRIPKPGTTSTSDKVVATKGDVTGTSGGIANEMLAKVYPVGSIYMNGSVATNPRTLLGWTASNWEKYGVGRSPMGASGDGKNPSKTPPSGLNLAVVGMEYGEYTHTLNINEMPSHGHNLSQFRNNGGVWQGGQSGGVRISTNPPRTPPTDSAGGDRPHNNTHPVVVTHMWRRTS